MASTQTSSMPHPLRSILLRPKKLHAAAHSAPPLRKKGLAAAAAAIRGLGCSSSSAQAVAPSSNRRKKRRERKDDVDAAVGSSHLQIEAELVPEADVEVEVGIRFNDGEDELAAEEEVDFDGEDMESNFFFHGRRSGMARFASANSSSQSHAEPRVFELELGLQRHLRRSWRMYSSPGLLEELMMFEAGLLLGEMDIFDRFRDMRLDVDNMSYEELLELGDTIGHVNTGLREDEIPQCIRKTKYSILDTLLHLSAETDRKCCICLDEYRVGDEVGKLGCGHGYHTFCIKQWLLRKNSCPFCKAAPVCKS